jgi:hypothetical protein
LGARRAFADHRRSSTVLWLGESFFKKEFYYHPSTAARYAVRFDRHRASSAFTLRGDVCRGLLRRAAGRFTLRSIHTRRGFSLFADRLFRFFVVALTFINNRKRLK